VLKEMENVVDFWMTGSKISKNFQSAEIQIEFGGTQLGTIYKLGRLDVRRAVEAPCDP